MRFLILFTSCLFQCMLHAQDFEVEWVHHYNSKNGNVRNIGMLTDNNGNVYVTGNFFDTIVFDKGNKESSFVVKNYRDVFLTKTDACGNLIWARQFKSSVGMETFSIAIDSFGNVYTSGRYLPGNADFDPDNGNNILYSDGWPTYITKHDESGNLIWVKQFDASYATYDSDIAVSKTGHLYIGGFFAQTVDFDPGPNVYNLTAKRADSYIVKLDAEGNFIWAKQFESTLNVHVLSIAIDGNENIYAKGIFKDTVDFKSNSGNIRLISNNYYNIFTAKLNAEGQVLWVKQFTSNTYLSGISIFVDAEGNNYHLGTFSETLDLNSGDDAFKLTSKGNADIFMVKLNTDGEFLWTKHIVGSQLSHSYQIQSDQDGNLYITGYINGTFDFDPDNGSYELTAENGSRQFIAKYTSNGKIVWAMLNNDKIGLFGYEIAIKPNGIYLTGNFNKNVAFQTDSGTVVFNSDIGYDGFVLKLKNTNPRKLFDKKDIILCEGETIVIGTNYWPGDKFLWSTGETTPAIVVTDTGTYNVKVEYCNKTYFDTIHVLFRPKPTVNLGQDTAFCGVVDLVIKSVTTDAHSYSWNTGDTTSTLHVTREGVYSLTVKSEYSCENSDTVLIDKIDYPEKFKDNEFKVCFDNQLTLDAQNPGNSFLWSTGEYSQTIVVTHSDRYFVTISNQFCSISDSVDVLFLTEEECTPYLFVPNAFSPNGDGSNDFFIAVGQNIRSFDLQIFNRWGQMIYTASDSQFKWDGTFNGNICPDGIYTVIIQYQTNLEPGKMLLYKSNLHLIR